MTTYKEHLIKMSFIIPTEVVDVPYGYDGYSDEPEDQARFVPDIQAWIDEFLPPKPTSNSNRPPRCRAAPHYYDADELGGTRSFWMVTFLTEEDKAQFQARWHDDLRFAKFREAREERRRFMAKMNEMKAAVNAESQ